MMNKDDAIRFVKKNGVWFQSLDLVFRNDKEVLLEAVKVWGDALGFTSDELRSDKEVVIVAVKKFPRAYRFSGVEMQKDREIINLVKDFFKKNNETVDDYLCEELKEQKKLYEVETLEMLLDLEDAKQEIKELSHIVGKVKISDNRNRL